MNISEKTLPDFIEVLASKEAVPGGGGAAALCGAIGTALGNMVGSLTVGKKKYADVEEEIIALKAKSDALQKRFLELIDEDAKGFEPLSKAYGLPATTDEEKAHKAEVLEQCSKDACQVPMEIMECCAQAIDIIAEFAAKGSALAVSDAGCGATICKSAMFAASLNIFINTKGMADRDYAAALNEKALNMLHESGNKADEIFGAVYQKLQPAK
ncbi:MAG: cyclodeaminase/cyclohydrolase family protein [Lachnospiraceae bacterium]|nr:cyclodeaminase/cyclohydrolase family protein [Lachnospiraceae bacterium]